MRTVYVGEDGVLKLGHKVFEQSVFWYLDAGLETHGRRRYRFWLSNKLLKYDDSRSKWYLEFPIKDASIITTEKGNLVIKRMPGKNIFWLTVPCGYRGDAELKILTEPHIEYVFYEYESPRGSLGISTHALVVVETDFVEYSWGRTGRVYGKPHQGVSIMRLNGAVEDLHYIMYVDDVKKELDD